LPDNRFFEIFGLEPALNLDLKALEARYFELSRKWHPDLFARKSEEDRKTALDQTALLNDAYRTLRDPVKRAEYVTGHEEGRAPQAPPELLEEVFELNMALEELRSGDADALPQLESQKQHFQTMRDAADRQLAELSAAYDNGTSSPADIRALLNRRKYIHNLLKEVDKALDAGN